MEKERLGTVLKKKHLSKCYRIFLFFIIINIDSTYDISGGILSSSIKEIKKQLKLNDTKYSGFGTAASIGRIISSFLFLFLNKKVNLKYFIIALLGFHSICLFCFKLTNNANILIILRGLQGLSHSPSIYVPVWINQYGLNEYKTLQITSIQYFQEVDKLLGHFIILIIGFENWQNGFVICGLYLTFLTKCCSNSEEKYFSKTLYPRKFDKKKNVKRSSDSTIFEEHGINKNENKKENHLLDIALLLKNPLYLLSLICRSIIRGLITCLH